MAINKITKDQLRKREFDLLNYEQAWSMIAKHEMETSKKFNNDCCTLKLEEFIKWFYQFGIFVIPGDKNITGK